MTDKGAALVKYMGNRAGLDSLVSELLAGELASKLELQTPDFAIVDIPSIETGDPFVTVQPGPAFFSRWEQAQSLAPNSRLLASLRRPADVSRLVVFDTWIRNKDRFADDPNGTLLNYDNILFKADIRKTQLLVIDHSHAFAETSLEAEMDDDWANERVVYGLFNEFQPMLKRRDVKSAIDMVSALDVEELRTICQSPPAQWGITTGAADRMAELLSERAKLMSEWVPDAIFAQMELNLDGKED